MDALLQKKMQEDEAIKQSKIIQYTIHFEGKNTPLILSKVSVYTTQTIKLTKTFPDTDRLCDLLTYLRGKLQLKDNESVALTHIKMKITSVTHDQPKHSRKKKNKKKTNFNQSIHNDRSSTTTTTTKLVRRSLAVMEWNEEEEDLGDEHSETSSISSAVEPWGLDPLLTLKDVQLFTNNCTVSFVTNENLHLRFPPERSEPKSMPSGQLVKDLRERLKVRRRRRKK